MIWLPIGIVIGVVLTFAGGIAFAVAGEKLERRDRRVYERYLHFVGLVGMDLAHRDRLALQQGNRSYDSIWPYAQAMRVDPQCLPSYVCAAALEFVSKASEGHEPEWVQYLPEQSP